MVSQEAAGEKSPARKICPGRISRPKTSPIPAELRRAACPHAAMTEGLLIPAVRHGRIYNAPLQWKTAVGTSVGADYISARTGPRFPQFLGLGFGVLDKNPWAH